MERNVSDDREATGRAKLYEAPIQGRTHVVTVLRPVVKLLRAG